MERPLRGLAGWGIRTTDEKRNLGLLEIAVQNVAVLGAILLGVWVARRKAEQRAGCLFAVAIVLMLILALVGISRTVFLLHGPW
jgi:hypothetical protein